MDTLDLSTINDLLIQINPLIQDYMNQQLQNDVFQNIIDRKNIHEGGSLNKKNHIQVLKLLNLNNILNKVFQRNEVFHGKGYKLHDQDPLA